VIRLLLTNGANPNLQESSEDRSGYSSLVYYATDDRKAKFIRLYQAAVLAGYVPSDEKLQKLQLEADRDHSEGHQIQQLVNWLNEDRQQVPSLLRQCRVVIRRQLSAAVHFQSILPAIDKLPLTTNLKLYLQFGGILSEVDLSKNKELRGSDSESSSDDELFD